MFSAGMGFNPDHRVREFEVAPTFSLRAHRCRLGDPKQYILCVVNLGTDMKSTLIVKVLTVQNLVNPSDI